MTYRDDIQSAQRHLGVAIIDLTYAASDFDNALQKMRKTDADDMSRAQKSLKDHVSALRYLSQIIAEAEHLPRTSPAHKGGPDIERWWPDLVSRDRALATGLDPDRA